MNTYGVDLMGRRRRRRHTTEFKAAVIGECRKPGVSIAAVALARGDRIFGPICPDCRAPGPTRGRPGASKHIVTIAASSVG